MEEEIEGFLHAAKNVKTEKWQNFTFYKGQLYGKEVVIARVGIGKSISAILTQYFVMRFSPQYIVFTGVAGALNKEASIGDVYIAKDCMQYDLDTTALGVELGTIVEIQRRFLPTDPKLRNLALSTPLKEVTIREGRILTGDAFLSTEKAHVRQFLSEELDGDAIEMEGASVGLVAYVNQIPFLLIRTISDRADGTAVEDFSSFVNVLSRTSRDIVEHVFLHLPR